MAVAAGADWPVVRAIRAAACCVLAVFGSVAGVVDGVGDETSAEARASAVAAGAISVG